MINLLPPNYPRPKSLDEKITIWVVSLSLLTVFILITSFYLDMIYQNNNLTKKIEVAKIQLNAVNKKTAELKRLQAEAKSLKNSLTKRDSIIGTDIYWPNVLNELKVVIPNQTWVRNFNITSHNSLRISGYTLSNKELDDIINNFRKSNIFTNIKLVEVRKQDVNYSGYQSVKGFHYVITANINDNNEIKAELKNGGDDLAS